MKAQKLTLVNKVTGEVAEFEYRDLEDAEALYLLIKSTLDLYEKAKGRLLEYIGKQVDERHEFSNGYTGQWIQGRRLKYRPEVVRKYLDEDQMALVVEINGPKLKALLADLVETDEGLMGAWREIEASADATPTKPYFVIKKG